LRSPTEVITSSAASGATVASKPATAGGSSEGSSGAACSSLCGSGSTSQDRRHAPRRGGGGAGRSGDRRRGPAERRGRASNKAQDGEAPRGTRCAAEHAPHSVALAAQAPRCYSSGPWRRQERRKKRTQARAQRRGEFSEGLNRGLKGFRELAVTFPRASNQRADVAWAAWSARSTCHARRADGPQARERRRRTRLLCFALPRAK
jgi:hypothetical protein